MANLPYLYKNFKVFYHIEVFIFGHYCIKIGHLWNGVHGTNFHNYL